MNMSARINKILTPVLKKRLCRKFNAKMIPCMRNHQELFRKVDPETTAKFKSLWSRLVPVKDDMWLRFFCNLSGIKDYRYMPEDIYLTQVERILNDTNRVGGEAEDKNQYSLFIDREHQPRFLVRFIRGMFFDEDYKFLSDGNVSEILSKDNGPLIGKVAVGSGGGHGVKGLFYQGRGYFDKEGSQITAEWIRRNFDSYVIQEKIKQCDFSAQFNPYSANTCRIMTFRRPWDGVTCVAKAGMRFGAKSEVFDNLSSGGICVCLDSEGRLSKIGRTWYHMDQWDKHPVSGVVFEGKQHPYFKEMCRLACKYAAHIPNFNLISWDMVADEDGIVKILEINETSQSSDWVQYDFGPFFGDLTERVVDWCVENRHFDNFKHIRL